MLLAEAIYVCVLQWLRQNDCPWYFTSVAEAKVFGHTHVVEQWVIVNGCPTGMRRIDTIGTTSPFFIATQRIYISLQNEFSTCY